ncbi:methyl-accepting chemotaxis protein [Desulfovibrio mangrovi]|uniref:methyl-accepting chemotaxis protein n=1 Tax=Desulfovibrio mangrovi TaxID=2976983 RepID=UPI002247A813|nr:methyl-accepting chemotaxis protein [Desulfovibrio mangrovi]UZP68471.1 methyl-accepting chemotaxis protein [Desulfovibrio mangrovi]
MLESCFFVMRKVRASLAKVVSSREKDFLELGEDLHEASSRADKLVEDARELVDSTVGEILEEVLRQMDEKLAVLQTMSGKTDSGDAEEFLAIRRYLAELLRLLENYGRIVRTLQMLAISTRIESARLGSDGRGFNTLADDVEKLAVKIVEYSSTIRAHVNSLDTLAATAGERMHVIQRKQVEYSGEVAERIKGNLEALHEYGHRLSGVSLDLSQSFSSIQDSMGGIVASMQFHDIVRQQVEHVEEVLEDVTAFIQAESAGHDDREVAEWIRSVNSIQVSQLVHARESFTEAVGSLRTELDALGGYVEGVSGIVEEAHTGDGTQSPLEAMGTTVAVLSDHFAQLARAGEDVGNVMVSVVNTVSEMTSFLEDIEEVGAEIELIALNASIRAAHTGDMGKALGVLASSIQTLSKDAGIQTVDIADKLRAIAGSADTLRDHAEGYLDTSQAKAMTDELDGFMEQLRFVDCKGGGLLMGIRRDAERLTGILVELSQGIQVDVLVAADLMRAQRELEDLLASLPCGNGEAAVMLPEPLKAILDRYTMESERAIHRSMLGSRECGGIDLFDDASDSNIELF